MGVQRRRARRPVPWGFKILVASSHCSGSRLGALCFVAVGEFLYKSKKRLVGKGNVTFLQLKTIVVIIKPIIFYLANQG